MPIRFRCPACRKPLSIGKRKALTQVSCPRCHGDLTVPPASDYLRRSRPQVADAGEVLFAAHVAQPVLPEPPAATAPAGVPARPRLLPRAALVAAGVLLAVVPTVVAVCLLFRETPDPAPEPTEMAVARQPAPLPLDPVPPARPTSEQEEPRAAAAPEPPPAPAPAVSEAPPVKPDAAPPAAAPAETKTPAAAPAEKAPVAREPEQVTRLSWEEKWRHKRRSRTSDEDLRKQLLAVPEAALDAVPNSAAVLVRTARSAGNSDGDLAPLLMARRPDLAGLPRRMGMDCRLGKESAENLHALSRKLRAHVEACTPGAATRAAGNADVEAVADPRPDPQALRDRLLGDAEKEAWLHSEAVPALEQLLMAENKSVRLVLVELLSRIEGRQASEALAGHALFDLHPEVRQAAVKALQDRPAEEYGPALLRGLQHPWQPVADHAAEALVLLERRDTVPQLIPLLERDPARPVAVEVNRRRMLVVPEMVRVNHLANCLLCHPPSFHRADLVRGRVPTPGQPLSASPSSPQAYQGGGDNDIFVRADVTYLKQDFSICQPVAHPGPWPTYQRYDYMVRLRPLLPSEADLWKAKGKGPASPRRESVLFALRELTGKDLGSRAEDWKQLLPIRDPGPADDAQAGPAARADLPEPADNAEEAGRLAVAEFLARGPVADLRRQLRDGSREVRHAAVLACDMTRAAGLVPDLTERLKDTDEVIALEARRVLARLDPLFPFRVDAQRLSKALTEAAPDEQEKLVLTYRAGKGPAYDLALAAAIPGLLPETRGLARAALAERLASLPLPELREKLAAGDRELRYATAQIAGRNKTWPLVPDLIALLNDPDPLVVQRARQSLRQITTRDIGPEVGASRLGRLEVVADWQAWWKAQGVK
jgi:HEAT repeat protein